jgi:hypothetical protein
MKTTKIIRVSWLNWFAIPSLGFCFISGIILFEWIRIVLIKDPNEIGKYYFGSEAMAAHGGWRYSSAVTYAWSAFAEGFFLLLVSVLTLWHSLQAKKKETAIGCALMILWLILNRLK